MLSTFSMSWGLVRSILVSGENSLWRPPQGLGGLLLLYEMQSCVSYAFERLSLALVTTQDVIIKA